MKMKKFLFFSMVVLLCGCKQGKLERIDIQLDKETLNLVLEPDVMASMKVIAYYSNGSRKELKASEYVASTKTVNASGGVQVIAVDGDKIIPKDGGVGEVSAVYVNEGKTLTATKKIVVRPYYRDYHKTLVLKLFMAMEGEPPASIKSDPNELVFNQKDPSRICTFAEALDLVKRVDNVTRGVDKIIYLVGWQRGGHDHLYPDWSIVNEKLKRPEDATALESLRWLIREARAYNTTVSLHINMNDAYKDNALWQEYKDKDCLCRNADGSLQTYDFIEGHTIYHVNLYNEWKEGLAKRRIDRLIAMIPELKEGHTIHIDAFMSRYYDWNYRSPWHAMKENGGIDMYKETEAQRKIFHYWRDNGFDVTGEGIFWAHPPGEGFVGLQPYSWWMFTDIKFQMEIPERLSARGATERGVGGQELRQGDFRFGSSIHGEYIFLRDKENLPGFLREFCTMTLPWYYLSQLQRVALIADTLYYSNGVIARVENGKKIIRKGDFILREDDNLFVPALWKAKEIIAYSQAGYTDRAWVLPVEWKDVNTVDLYKITLKGLEPMQKAIQVKNGKLTLTLQKEEGVSIVPAGSTLKETVN